MTARPVIVIGPTGRAFGVLTSVRRRDTSGPRIEKVTSGDSAFAYTVHDRGFTHCIDGCLRAEIGVLTLSEQSFRIAATVGLPLRVWGLRGRYDGTVPAESFVRVLVAADAPD